MNRKEGRKLPVGSSHGSGTAESVAKLYGILANGGQYKGKQVLSQEAIQSLERPAVTGVDQMLGILKQNGMGTWLMPVIEDNDLEKVDASYNFLEIQILRYFINVSATFNYLVILRYIKISCTAISAKTKCSQMMKRKKLSSNPEATASQSWSTLSVQVYLSG